MMDTALQPAQRQMGGEPVLRNPGGDAQRVQHLAVNCSINFQWPL